MGPSFIEQLAIRKFHGVGPVTAEKMEALGIHTGADLRACSLEFLQSHFGKSGAWYHSIARGADDRPVEADRRRKSSGSETTFPRDLTEGSDIDAGAIAMADEVWTWCDKHQVYGQTVTVKIKYADFRIVTRARSFQSPVTTREQLREVSVALVRTLYPVVVGIRLVGVSVSKFADATFDEQLDLLFEETNCVTR